MTTRLGITIGDAAGIGPEIILKALRAPLPGVTPIVYGAMEVLRGQDAALEAMDLTPRYAPLAERLCPVEDPSQPVPEGAIGVVEVLDGDHDWASIEPGARHALCARLQGAALDVAIAHARQGHIQAITTAPWTKEIFRLIGAPPTGHTEVLAEAFEAPEHVMMLAGPRLRVALATVHVPLARVSQELTRARLRQVLETTARDLRRLFGVDVPRIAVCGLNPHAGEHGVMGTEEAEVIAPTLEACAEALGATAELVGPLPSDTLFGAFRQGQPYDAVVCMYHDQGLIPLKLLHFGESANLTLGLPIVRTSVDHGTAHDIAGRGVADASSMRHALELACELTRRASEGRVYLSDS